MNWKDRLFSIKKEYLYYIIIGVITISVLCISQIIYVLNKNADTETIEEIKIVDEVAKVDVKSSIKVDIKGQVKKPGVYEMDEENTVFDLIKESGGLLETADTNYINLSKKLKDEMVVIIYSKQEIKEMKEGKENVVFIEGDCKCPQIINDACIGSENTVNNTEDNKKNNVVSNLINLNTATLEELQTLTGIGLSKAKNIIDYREANQGFKSIEEIKEVKGIGDAVFQKIQDYITVS